jgi:hypothetical protein
MKKPRLLIFTFFMVGFIALACSTTKQEPVATSGVEQEMTAKPTENVPTLTLAPTITITPTPEPVFHAGIPSQIEACNEIKIYDSAGAVDSQLIEYQMDRLVQAEKEFIRGQGISGEDIAELKVLDAEPYLEPEKYPYSFARAEGRLIPVSCSRVDAGDGSWRLMVGVVVKQDIQASAVAVLHVLLDHPGLEKVMTAEGNKDEYEQKFSPQATFKALATGPQWYFSFRLWIPDEKANPNFFADWRVSHGLMEVNQDAPIALNRYLFGTKLDPTLTDSYVLKLERMIFPAMWLWVTAIP